MEQVSEFKYLDCILDESGTDIAEYYREMARRRKVAGTFRLLVNTRSLQLK